MKVGQNLPAEVSEECDFQECLKAQITEMEKFKWLLGEKLGHDPLLDRPLNAIYGEWIQTYGPAFRDWWEKNKREKRKLNNCNACDPTDRDLIFNEINPFIKKALTPFYNFLHVRGYFKKPITLPEKHFRRCIDGS